MAASLGLLAPAIATPATASAAETARLHTSFTPNRLGASTTIGFGFEIEGTEGELPSPLRAVRLSLPPGINYLTSTLGLAICKTNALLAHGISGCPVNSRLGTGSAYVEVPFGSSRGREIPDIEAFMGPPHKGNIVVVFYAEGKAPVSAQLVFSGELVAGTKRSSGSLNTLVPLVPSVPEGPPVSIIRVHATIGPKHLVYQERVHGHLIHFHPEGVSLPLRCPRGGFHFSAQFAFQNGTTTTATSTVPCPRKHRHGKQSRRGKQARYGKRQRHGEQSRHRTRARPGR